MLTMSVGRKLDKITLLMQVLSLLNPRNFASRGAGCITASASLQPHRGEFGLRLPMIRTKRHPDHLNQTLRSNFLRAHHSLLLGTQRS